MFIKNKKIKKCKSKNILFLYKIHLYLNNLFIFVLIFIFNMKKEFMYKVRILFVIQF